MNLDSLNPPKEKELRLRHFAIADLVSICYIVVSMANAPIKRITSNKARGTKLMVFECREQKYSSSELGQEKGT